MRRSVIRQKFIIPKSNTGSRNLAFAEDLLSITVSGPTRPNFTVVDLPGLIRATNDQQTDEDIKLINTIVHRYIDRPRTTVLAVLQASVDQNNQDITKKIKRFKAYDRTLSIITKPDTFAPRSDQEKAWVTIANGEIGIPLMGWHVLKNL